jgi:hypothetical protein
MDLFRKLIGKAVDTPLNQRFLSTPGAQTAKRAGVGILEAINPFDRESRGNNLVNSTVKSHGGTGEFKGILDRVNPYYGGKPESSSSLINNSKALGWYMPNSPVSRTRNSRLWVADAPDSENIMFHEGLHAAFDETDLRTREGFAKLAQQVLEPMSDRPTARGYINSRLSAYKDAGDNPSGDFTTLSPDILTEVHSYLPEYYSSNGEQMPNQLANYYSRYYDTAKPVRRQTTRLAIRDLLRGPNDPFR